MDSAAEPSLRSALLEATARLDVAAAATDIAASTPIDAEHAERRLRTYLGEAASGLQLVGPHLKRGARVLEVGSGIGLLARVLYRAGFDICEVEPVGPGFEFIGATRDLLGTECDGPVHFDTSVDELTADAHGTYDLIFSNNVLEHLPDWRHALRVMTTLLAPGGRMVHACPNYLVPYEPHFGIPLLPLAPGATAKVISRRIGNSDLWGSLNWITSREVRKWATDERMLVEFRQGRLAAALDRLSEDEEFRSRHEAISVAARGLAALGLTRMMRRIPVDMATPMEFEVAHSESGMSRGSGRAAPPPG